MKRKTYMSALGAAVLAAAMTSCGGTTTTSGYTNDGGEGTVSTLEGGDGGASAAVVSEPIMVTVSGDLDPNQEKSKLVGATGSVTFSHFPNSLAEFEAVLPTLKETPQGAVLSQLMAMELFRRNREDGEKAFALCNVKSNVPMIMSRVPDLFGYAGTSHGGDGYARPYQVASFLEGANRDNGYKPSEPYTVNMKVSVNGAVYSDTFQAKVLYLQVESEGTDSGYRACEVINTKKPGEPSGWIVFNCPGLYTQCKEISFEKPFEGMK